MSMDQAIEYALQLATRIASAGVAHVSPDAPVQAAIPGDNPAHLTAREQEVATLLARGLRNSEVGVELIISERTVEKHVANILGKLSLASRTQVAAWALRHGLGDQTTD